MPSISGFPHYLNFFCSIDNGGIMLFRYQCPLYRAFLITLALKGFCVRAGLDVSMPSISGFPHYTSAIVEIIGAETLYQCPLYRAFLITKLYRRFAGVTCLYQCPLYRAFLITTAFSPSFDQLYHF